MSTGIQWTDETWNPIRAGRPVEYGGPERGWHCERVSPGCEHCYAETLNVKRFGTGLGYIRSSREKVNIYLDEKTLTAPLHWRKPRRVFVCSMTDLFGEWVPDEMLDRMFAVMALAQRHTFQILTKRPERQREYLAGGAQQRIAEQIRHNEFWSKNELYREDWASAVEGDAAAVHGNQWPIGHIWLGVSVEDQQRADERIPVLLETPAAVRFLSCEPLLGALRIDEIRGPDGYEYLPLRGMESPEPRLHWVIVGGESGPGARPFDLAWARSIVAQCKAANVAVFVKQLGRRPFEEVNRAKPVWMPQSVTIDADDRFHYYRTANAHGSDMSEWPADLRVREFPR